MSDQDVMHTPAHAPASQDPAPAPAREPHVRGDEAARGSEPIPLVHTKPLLDDMLRDEVAFANRTYAPYAGDLAMNPKMFRKYAMPTALWDWRQRAAMLLGEITGKDLLDLGCGMGEEAVYFAKLGARVTAIDISDVGIAITKRRAAYNHVDLRAFEMRCDPTSFAPASFDRIHGIGILHHVGIDAALGEVRRLLRPGGVGVFLEPLGDHPKIEAAKAFLRKHARFLRSFEEVTEHDLTWREIDEATARFSRTAVYPYHLVYRVNRFVPALLRDGLRRVDHRLLAALPRLRRYAGAVVIQVVR